MKIVLEIPHPNYKITIFKSGFKHIVKFDQSAFDLSIKFLDGEFENLAHLKRLILEKCLPQLEPVFDVLREVKAKSLAGDPPTRTEDFPQIL